MRIFLLEWADPLGVLGLVVERQVPLHTRIETNKGERIQWHKGEFGDISIAELPRIRERMPVNFAGA